MPETAKNTVSIHDFAAPTALKAASCTLIFLAAWVSICGGAVRGGPDGNGSANVGERFFLETRFSRFFYVNSGGDANFVLTNGDPVMATTATIRGPLPGPFAGQAMNCRACHLVQEHENVANRTYCDFARRTPIPANGDGRTQTPRNSIDLVDSVVDSSVRNGTPNFLHYDGQFVTPEDLIITTFTGRNFGWHPSEYSTALAHIVHIIREDNGQGGLAQRSGGYSYAQALAGGLQIPSPYRILRGYELHDVTITNTADPNYVSDERIIQNIAGLVAAYLRTLVFSQDVTELFNGSPYDTFLIKNGLPRGPAASETPFEYSQRLRNQLQNLANPLFVSDPADGHFVTHNQVFQFGPAELAGLKIFLTDGKPILAGTSQGPAGNCVACHSPPAFTDFLFHNTGAAQEEYDAIHGQGSFMGLAVPNLAVRQTNYDAFLPPTPNHPNALGTFITPPSASNPGEIDLGLWNVFANPDFPNPQPALQQVLPQLLPVPSPRITLAAKTGSDFVLGGTNGLPGWTYYVVLSTNLADPSSGWTILSTNTFDALGNFSVTNELMPSAFFRIAAAPPTAEQALPRMIALFKTQDVRDLSSSEPYLHTGRMDTIEAVIEFYQTFSNMARVGAIRNAAPELQAIFLDDASVASLAAFLRSLNEDYQDIPCPCL